MRRRPHPTLDGVRSIVGFREVAERPLARREVAQPCVTVIVNLGPPLRVGGRDERMTPRGSFVAPMNGHWGLTEFAGESEGIQIDLEPSFAHRILRVPMGDLDRVVTPLEEIVGRWGRELAERLGNLSSWDDRMDLLERSLIARSQAAKPRSPDLERAWQRLRASAGRVSASDLASDLGCSPRHLSKRFHEEVGIGPKGSARIIRFRRAVDLLSADDGSRYAEIAASCGYSDQPHMNRDFRDLAGVAPGRSPDPACARCRVSRRPGSSVSSKTRR